MAGAVGATGADLRVAVDASLAPQGLGGRLVVVLADTNAPEPLRQIGGPSRHGPILLGVDAKELSARNPVRIGAGATVFPMGSWHEVPRGAYWAQAVLMTNRDLRLPDAPGNLVSVPRRIETGRPTTLVLSRKTPPDDLPSDTEYVRHVRFRSEKLSAHHGRPIFLRAAVLLPRGHAAEPARRYPLVVQTGGFGSRYTRFDDALAPGGRMRAAWEADDTPRMLVLALDGAGPAGDPYQVNSDNHGPYGDAVVQELLPHVEREFRAAGRSSARFTTGGSTGGWVSLALQVFYPDVFGGCWSGYPDAADFRSFGLIDVYAHTNAFVTPTGFERPAARTRDGDVDFTVRFEVAMENVFGDGGSYARGGGQWGSWNATYAPRGPDGWPVPLWDPVTGAIDRGVAGAWKRHDLRLLLAEHWPVLATKLRGKLHVWVGESDEYFLDNAVHRLDDFLRTLRPPAEARFEYGPRQGHGWDPRPFTETLREMLREADASAPKAGESARDEYFRNRFLHGTACPHCRGGR
jgi:S-formylglutathione hydrolase FrmB